MSVQIVSGAENTGNANILYENIFEDGTLTVSSAAADGAGANAVEDTTFDFWTPTSVPATFNVDYGSAVECDCVGIAAHNAGMNGSSIQVLSSSDDITYTLRASTTPLTDDTIMIMFPAVTARYWRVAVTAAVCSIGVIKLGKKLEFPSGVLTSHTAINHASRVELLTNQSIKGQYLGTRIKRVGADASVNFGLVDVDFMENDMAVFEAHYNSGRTFFYSSSASDHPDDYGYCWRAGSELRPSYEEGGTLAQVDMDLSVYVEQ